LVVLADVLGQLVTLGAVHGFGLLGLCFRLLAGDNRCSGHATGTDSQQEISTGKLGC
jgi:hypothetical protein